MANLPEDRYTGKEMFISHMNAFIACMDDPFVAANLKQALRKYAASYEMMFEVPSLDDDPNDVTIDSPTIPLDPASFRKLSFEDMQK